MLIVAIPKSASTSLMDTLADAYGRPARQDFFRDRPRPPDFDMLSRYHSDIRELDSDISAACDGSEIRKQHFPPTDNNLALLQEVPKVILLRAPDEIVAAYRRAERAGIHKPRPEFAGCRSEQEWLARAETIGLLDDLHRFHDRWMGQPDALVISYQQVVEDPTRTAAAVGEQFGLGPPPGPVKLARRRYSRSKVRRAWRLLRAKGQR